MAVVTPTREDVNNGVVFTWAAMANGDTGGPIEAAEFADRTMQFTGTFGAGGSVSGQGSNDGTNYATLADPQGNALTATAAKIEQVLECVRYLRPNVTAGDGTTSLTVTMFARRSIR